MNKLSDYPTVTTEEYKEILRTAIQGRVQLLAVGAPGIGKSKIYYQVIEEFQKSGVKIKSIVTDVEEILAIRSYTEITSIKEPIEYSGIQDLSGNTIATGLIKKLIEPFDGLTVVFIDDLTQAPAQVLNPLTQLMEDRKIEGFVLPDKDRMIFIGACNDKSHKSNASGLPEMLKGRFDTLIHVKPDVDSLTEYAINKNWDKTLIAFFRGRPEFIEQKEFSHRIEQGSNSRNFESLDKILKLYDNDKPYFPALVSGAVGEEMSIEFLAFRELVPFMPCADTIINAPDSALMPEEITGVKPETVACIYYALIGNLVERSTESNISNLYKYMKRAPSEFAYMLHMDISKRKPDLMETETFINYICELNNN